MANASRWTRAYTAEQKQALLRAVLLDGVSVADARRMASAGQLGVPAFELSTAAYGIVREGRETFEASNETALQRAIDHEMHAAELDALAHIRAVRLAFKRDEASNPDALKRATRALADIQRARRDTKAGRNNATKPKSTTYTPDTQRETTSTVTDLLGLVPKSARSGSLTDAPNPDRIGVQSPGLDAA